MSRKKGTWPLLSTIASTYVLKVCNVECEVYLGTNIFPLTFPISDLGVKILRKVVEDLLLQFTPIHLHSLDYHQF